MRERALFLFQGSLNYQLTKFTDYNFFEWVVKTTSEASQEENL